jgi:hypothetical protein
MPKTQTATKIDDRPFVRLTGEAAVALRGTLGEPVKKKMLARKAAEVTEDTYRVVVSPEQAKALKEGTQVWAKPGKGDVSLRLRDAATSKPMPEARLEKVGDSAKAAARPSVTKVLGPAAWEAMAMATQQHYLVEINDKLEGIATNIEEVLQRLDDDERGTLSHVAKTVEDSHARLADHGALSSGRVDEPQRSSAEAIHAPSSSKTAAGATVAATTVGSYAAIEVENFPLASTPINILQARQRRRWGSAQDQLDSMSKRGKIATRRYGRMWGSANAYRYLPAVPVRFSVVPRSSFISAASAESRNDQLSRSPCAPLNRSTTSLLVQSRASS